MFHTLCLSVSTMLCVSFSCVVAVASPYQAGIVRIDHAAASEQADTVIWYPTDQPEISWQAGPFQITATKGAPVAEGRFPVVLLSHGRQGGPFSHRELAAHLAREGFIVIAPTHAGDAAGQPLALRQDQILKSRPGQAIAALDTSLKDVRLASHADSGRIGMIGYSAGGYTGLTLAGAKPDFALAAAYCAAEGRDDIGTCGPAGDNFADGPTISSGWTAPVEPRLKALVLLDPLAVMFDATSLTDIKIPALLYRPEDDLYMRSAANAVALAHDLPQPPQEIVAPGNHFTFVDPCPEIIAGEAAMVCGDEPGIDRPAMHRALERAITDFLNANL